jgi:hypothetical protein
LFDVIGSDDGPAANNESGRIKRYNMPTFTNRRGTLNLRHTHLASIGTPAAAAAAAAAAIAVLAGPHVPVAPVPA